MPLGRGYCDESVVRDWGDRPEARTWVSEARAENAGAWPGVRG